MDSNKEAEAKAYERYELFLNNPKAYWEEIVGLRGTYGRFTGRSGRPSQIRALRSS